MTDTDALLCGLVSEVDRPIEGSVKTVCHDCGSPVWIAPTGQAGSYDLIVCVPCGLTRIDKERQTDEGGVEVRQLTSDQIVELLDHDTSSRLN